MSLHTSSSRLTLPTSSAPARYNNLTVESWKCPLVSAFYYNIVWCRLSCHRGQTSSRPVNLRSLLLMTLTGTTSELLCTTSLVTCLVSVCVSEIESWTLFFFWFVASMARKVYLRGGLGVGAFRRIYGGSKRNGSRPPHFLQEQWWCCSSHSAATPDHEHRRPRHERVSCGFVLYVAWFKPKKSNGKKVS